MDVQTNRSILVSSLWHASKLTAVESPKGMTVKNLFAKKFLELIEAYGKEGRALVQKCRERWFDVMTIPTAKRATTFDDYVAQRVLNSGAGYVLTRLICDFKCR